VKKKVGRNDNCPCGSGEEFKNCCGKKGQKSLSTRSNSGWYVAAILTGVLIVLAVLFYNSRSSSNSTRTASNIPLNLPYNSGVAGIIPTNSYTEIPGIDFSTLSDLQRKTVLERANRQNCTCGCGYTIAGCRHLDTTCGTNLPLAQQIVAQVRAGS